ncbi:MAG: hypothetical protein ABI572_05445 [Actinomycetota bacterium]
MMVYVQLIDYMTGETHLYVVGADSGTVLAKQTSNTVATAVGEQGVRRIYGTALADPGVAAVAGEQFSVSADAIPFSTKGGPCAEGAPVGHRCLYGTIFTPEAEISVFADLTGASLEDWSVEKDGT